MNVDTVFLRSRPDREVHEHGMGLRSRPDQSPVCYLETRVVIIGIISPTRRPSSPVPYKLFGVVYHHGRTAAGGHYTCDVLRQNDEWLHIDDTNITVISEADVTMRIEGTNASHGPKPAMNGTLVNGGASEAAALAAAISASTAPASRSSDGVAYVLFYIRTDQKNMFSSGSEAGSGSIRPHSGSLASKPITNGVSHAKASPVSATGTWKQ